MEPVPGVIRAESNIASVFAQGADGRTSWPGQQRCRGDREHRASCCAEPLGLRRLFERSGDHAGSIRSGERSNW